MGLLKHVYLIINNYNKQVCASLGPQQSSQAIKKNYHWNCRDTYNNEKTYSKQRCQKSNI